MSCAAPGPRPYFIRSAGGYHDPAAARHAVKPNRSPDLAKLGFPGPAAGGPASARLRLKEVADSYLGVPYRFGGSTRGGMDCSGFIKRVFSQVHGLELPHNAARMYRHGGPVSRSDLKPGDLVFFQRFFVIFHAGIHMGGGYFIHASSTYGVTYSHLDSPYFKARYAGARRVVDGGGG